MAEEAKDQKQFKVYFNGTKKEEIVNAGAKFSKFINNLIRPHSKVIKNLIINFFVFIDSLN
jgi:hypothetical protein